MLSNNTIKGDFFWELYNLTNTSGLDGSLTGQFYVNIGTATYHYDGMYYTSDGRLFYIPRGVINQEEYTNVTDYELTSLVPYIKPEYRLLHFIEPVALDPTNNPLHSTMYNRGSLVAAVNKKSDKFIIEGKTLLNIKNHLLSAYPRLNQSLLTIGKLDKAVQEALTGEPITVSFLWNTFGSTATNFKVKYTAQDGSQQENSLIMSDSSPSLDINTVADHPIVIYTDTGTVGYPNLFQLSASMGSFDFAGDLVSDMTPAAPIAVITPHSGSDIYEVYILNVRDNSDLEALGALCSWELTTNSGSYPVITLVNKHPTYKLQADVYDEAGSDLYIIPLGDDLWSTQSGENVGAASCTITVPASSSVSFFVDTTNLEMLEEELSLYVSNLRWIK